MTIQSLFMTVLLGIPFPHHHKKPKPTQPTIAVIGPIEMVVGPKKTFRTLTFGDTTYSQWCEGDKCEPIWEYPSYDFLPHKPCMTASSQDLKAHPGIKQNITNCI